MLYGRGHSEARVIRGSMAGLFKTSSSSWCAQRTAGRLHDKGNAKLLSCAGSSDIMVSLVVTERG